MGDHTKDLLGCAISNTNLQGSVQISRVLSNLSQYCPTYASTDAITLSNLWQIKQNPEGFYNNMCMENIVEANKELQLLSPGSIVLETTSVDQGCNIASLHSLASKAKVNGVSLLFACSIVPSTVIESRSTDYENKVLSKLREEVLAGRPINSEAAADSTNTAQTYTKASAIVCNLGEPFQPPKDSLTSNELSALKACGRLHSELSKDVTFGKDKLPPLIISLPPFSLVHVELLEILRAAGADLSKVVFNQVALSRESFDYYQQLLSAPYNCTLCVDTWGYCATFSSSLNNTHQNSFLSDQELLDQVLTLVHAGCQNQLVLSLAVYCKIQLTAYGGYGYSHIENSIAPALTTQLSGSNCEAISTNATAITRALTGGNLWTLLNWRPAPPPVAVTIDYLTCHICAKKFVPGNHFSKFGFEYCTTKCLGVHISRDWK